MIIILRKQYYIYITHKYIPYNDWLQYISLYLYTDPNFMSASQGIREVAEAVTHARFVGTSTASDEVVLMRILKV